MGYVESNCTKDRQKHTRKITKTLDNWGLSFLTTRVGEETRKIKKSIFKDDAEQNTRFIHRVHDESKWLTVAHENDATKLVFKNVFPDSTSLPTKGPLKWAASL